MKTVAIYTDGACSGNPGPGGWGAVLIYNENSMQLSGYEARTTNNRMELTAPIEALRKLKEPCEVKLYSDSAYLINAFKQRWIPNWIRRGWKKSDGKPVENVDLWQALLEAARPHKVEWIKVKGHADNLFNNMCDELATGEIKKHRNT